jgi:hypothetical protein
MLLELISSEWLHSMLEDTATINKVYGPSSLPVDLFSIDSVTYTHTHNMCITCVHAIFSVHSRRHTHPALHVRASQFICSCMGQGRGAEQDPMCRVSHAMPKWLLIAAAPGRWLWKQTTAGAQHMTGSKSTVIKLWLCTSGTVKLCQWIIHQSFLPMGCHF